MKNIYLFVFFCFISARLEAQQNFQKIYLFQDTFAVFNDIYVTDSCYYYTCTSGNWGARHNFNFGKIKLDGTEEILLLNTDATSQQEVMYSNSDMDSNFRGNLVTNYKNISALGMVPRVKEFSLNGDLISDYTLNDYWSLDSLTFRIEACRILQNNSDSSYFLFHQYHDNTTDNNTSEENGSGGTILIKLKYDGTIIWDKKYYYSPIGLYNPTWTVANLLKVSSSEFILVINEYKGYAPSQSELDWTKTHFIHIDENGNELSHNTFQDGQFCFAGKAATLLSDGGLLYSYYESILGGVPPNTDYFMPRPVITRLDNNYNVIWKKNLREFYGTDISSSDNMNEVKIVQDSLFVGAFEYIEEIIPNAKYNATLRLSQYNLNGINKWNRDYIYFPQDYVNDAEYSIYDLELTPDGGYIMAGQVFVYDSLLANVPNQFGYILKTNCLGFLGLPEAEISYTIDSISNIVEFHNNSLQAGSYILCFGDGDTLYTGESFNTLTHTYLNDGTFQGKLIAIGCNGEADTNYFTFTLNNTTIDSLIPNENIFTVFPNPAKSDGSFSVYLGNLISDNIQLNMYNELGQIVQVFKLEKPNTTYIIQSNYANGVYNLCLFSDEKKIEIEKLVLK